MTYEGKHRLRGRRPGRRVRNRQGCWSGRGGRDDRGNSERRLRRGDGPSLARTGTQDPDSHAGRVRTNHSGCDKNSVRAYFPSTDGDHSYFSFNGTGKGITGFCINPRGC